VTVDRTATRCPPDSSSYDTQTNTSLLTLKIKDTRKTEIRARQMPFLVSKYGKTDFVAGALRQDAAGTALQTS